MFETALELYNKLLNICKTKYDKFTIARKKKTKVQIILENLPTDIYLDVDDLPPMPALEGGEEARLEAEETIAERVKFNPRKRKKMKEQG